MYVDARQVVLHGIYAESQKDFPNMDNITHNKLGLGYDAFKLSIAKLQNEGLIRGAYLLYGRKKHVPLSVKIFKVSITAYGINILNQKLKSNYTTEQVII